ncbi:HSPB1-associated protein 1 [Linepithema humile]|uniref:HSPB1-associated protein 1 n=1 Tax=Linepithema humile TaxID=83485 RepID=UPI0006236F99|nr:PREDICTED: HSPB1-associated protein 1 isoform X3 [Linepithema humile]XP_012235128.1 PREDICTED: HSPB1-associated protein 1 isoform X3 [Linepithema humile]
MSDQLSELQAILKNCLATLQEPIIFRNMLRQSDGSYEWQLLRWSLSELVEVFGDKALPFRIGDHNKRTCSLQHRNWNVSPPVKPVDLTLEQFVKNSERLKYNKWLYYDYKHLRQCFLDKPEIINSFNWLKFGIDEELGRNGSNSTMWIGSKGAHTDCHQDTYGYNLVAQIHGRKLWLLYPPNNDLIPVRLPYEESTIYSRFNIYCLNEEEEECLLTLTDKPKLIILEPGDVLFIPNGWWHYVESLDSVSISVNIWGKLEQDNKARVKEALVKLLIAKIGDYKQFTVKKTTFYTTQVEHAINRCVSNEPTNESEDSPSESCIKKFKPDMWSAKSLAEQYPTYVELVPDAEARKFEEFLRERRNRDKDKYPPDRETASADCIPNPQYDSFVESIINALCHPEVIDKAAEVLLERHY